MAFTDSSILAMLKTYYAKAGLGNLLYRNDPLLKKLGEKAERIEGKVQPFSALYSRGGAVSADATVAVSLASTTAQAKEFNVTPGQLFSSCVYTNKEVLASRTKAGAYVPVATAKMFAALESFRKTLAIALYGTGHGDLFTLAGDFAAMTVGTDVTQAWPINAIYAVDPGSAVVYKTNINDPDSAAIAAGTVKSVNPANGTVVITPTAAGTPQTGAIVCLKGCTDDEGNPLLPVGLGGWLKGDIQPNDNFFGVNRSVAPERLAGVNYVAQSGEAKYLSIEKALVNVQAYGSMADVIVMNPEDALALQQEVEAKTYFIKADGGRGRAKADIGYDGTGISITGSFLEKVITSPYCPKGKAYILDLETVKLWTYSNADRIDDKQGDYDTVKDVAETGEDASNRPYQLLVDDLFTLNPSAITQDGAGTLVLVNFLGEFVVTEPCKNAVVNFAA